MWVRIPPPVSVDNADIAQLYRASRYGRKGFALESQCRCQLGRSGSHPADQVTEHTPPCENKKEVVYRFQSGLLAQSVRAPGCQPGGCGIVPRTGRQLFADVDIQQTFHLYLSVRQCEFESHPARSGSAWRIGERRTNKSTDYSM